MNPLVELPHRYTGEPLSVSPLTWSQAEYVRAVRGNIDWHSWATRSPSCGHPGHPFERRSDHQIAARQA